MLKDWISFLVFLFLAIVWLGGMGYIVYLLFQTGVLAGFF